MDNRGIECHDYVSIGISNTHQINLQILRLKQLKQNFLLLVQIVVII